VLILNKRVELNAFTVFGLIPGVVLFDPLLGRADVNLAGVSF